MVLLLDLSLSTGLDRTSLLFGILLLIPSMSANIIRQLNTSRGIMTLKIPSFIGTDNLINDAIKYSLESNYVKKGDKVVCLMGQNEETPEYVNIIKVTTV
jgi:pyruvate kinase